MKKSNLNFSKIIFLLISLSSFYILIYNIFHFSPILGYDAEAQRIDDALADRPENFTAAQKTEMQAVSAWLKTVRSNYASIDAWKIPHKQISFTWE